MQCQIREQCWAVEQCQQLNWGSQVEMEKKQGQVVSLRSTVKQFQVRGQRLTVK